MPLQRVRRLVALLLGAAYLAVPGGVLAGACPHEGRVPAAATAAELHGCSDAAAVAAHHAHGPSHSGGGHGAHRADSAQPSHAAAQRHADEGACSATHEHDGEHDVCTCIGTCTPGAALVLDAPSAVRTPVTVPARAGERCAAATQPRPHPASYLIPWSHAPPVPAIS